jgi:hypothetical protein
MRSSKGPLGDQTSAELLLVRADLDYNPFVDSDVSKESLMKSHLIISLFLFGGVTAAAQRGWERPPKAFGPVKTITWDKVISDTFSRDKTRIEETSPDGRNLVWLLTAEGRVLSAETFEKDGRPSGSKQIYNYDSKGRLTSKITHIASLGTETETFTYPADRLVKITHVSQPGKVSPTETDEYDNTGLITKATFHDADGTRTEVYEYDDKGNPTALITLDGEGRQIRKETYKYEFDTHGNWTTKYKESFDDPRSNIPRKTTITRTISYY